MCEEIKNNSVEETENVEESTTEEKDGKEKDPTEHAQDPDNEKKYTDADVDRIVSKRLNRERKRLSEALGKGEKETELEIRERKVLERELKMDVRERLAKDNLPESLSEIMNYSSVDGFNKSYEEITGVFKTALTEKVKPLIAGRIPKANGWNNTTSVDQKLSDIFNSR